MVRRQIPELVNSAMALATYLRRGAGNEAGLYRNFLQGLSGVELVEDEHQSPGVLIAGTADLTRVPKAESDSPPNEKRLISFYFKSGDLALLNEAQPTGSTPLFRGTWRQGLERLLAEFEHAHRNNPDYGEQIAVSHLLKSLY